MYHSIPFDLQDIYTPLRLWNVQVTEEIHNITSGNLSEVRPVKRLGNFHNMHGSIQVFTIYILSLRPIKICSLYQNSQGEVVVMKLPFLSPLESSLGEQRRTRQFSSHSRKKSGGVKRRKMLYATTHLRVHFCCSLICWTSWSSALLPLPPGKIYSVMQSDSRS